MPGLVSLQASLFTKTNERKSSASIVRVGPDGEPLKNPLRFQYWPDTISDTKSVNWTPREIPGSSLPIYQWINSGERLISFTATFTCDMDLQGNAQDEVNEDRVERLKAIGQQGRNVDIRAAVLWLRQFMIPGLGEVSGVGVPVAIAPERLLLTLPNTAIGITGGLTPSSHDLVDSIFCIMTTCDVSYEAFFPSGLPRVATVSLSFAQIAQKAGGGVSFPSRTRLEEGLGMDELATTDTGEFVFGYKLEVVKTKK